MHLQLFVKQNKDSKEKDDKTQQIFFCNRNKKLKDEITEMSANTIRKAKKLVESEGVAKIDDELYQVKSSTDPSKSYMVEKDSCECLGFKNFYKFHHGKGLKANCSHIEAVRIFKKEQSMNLVVKIWVFDDIVLEFD